ncbi:MAG: hypothetical protein JEY91_06085 [Spirochaetaceae bacterium]|nr:hypothetical protein [Spirochaetaceae bacterium]
MKYILLLLFPLMTLTIYAQDNDDEKDFTMELFADPIDESKEEEESDLPMDIFAEPEQEASREEESEEKEEQELSEIQKKTSYLSLLFRNLHGNIDSRYFGYFSTLEKNDSFNLDPQDRHHIFELHNELNSYTGNDIWRLNFNLHFNLGSTPNDYHSVFQESEDFQFKDFLQDRDSERRYFSVQELYGSLFMKKMDLHIGKKIISNSLSKMYSPADIYSAYDSVDPYNIIKRGRYLLEWNLFFGDSSLSIIILPLYQWGKNPDIISRWRYYSTIDQLTDMGWIPADKAELEVIENPSVDIKLANISYLLKFKSSLPGVDLFGGAFYGLNNNQVFQLSLNQLFQLEIESSVVPVINGSAGFSANTGPWGFHGEALYNHTLESKDDDYLRYVGGLSFKIDGFSGRSPFEQIEWILEYAGEWLSSEQSHIDYQVSSKNQRSFKNDFLLSSRISFKKDLELALFGQVNWKNPGGTFIAETNYKGIENWEFSLTGQFFFAESDSSAYTLRDNNRMIANVKFYY